MVFMRNFEHWITTASTLNKGYMTEAFRKQKEDLEKISDDLWNKKYFEEFVDSICKKEKKEMFEEIEKKRAISINYDGNTYRPNEIEVTYDPLSIYPRFKVEFTTHPSDRIKVEDTRCKTCPPMNSIDIDKVTFNGPKTIVEWKDGTKTIVNCDDENYDPEKGLAMAIVKKALGNKGNYYNAFRKAMEGARYYNQPEEPKFSLGDFITAELIKSMLHNAPMNEEENKE